MPESAIAGRALFLALTDDCNFTCPYCYHCRRPGAMDKEMVRTAMRLLLPMGRRASTVVFTGGEPLLQFPLIRLAVSEGKRLRGAAVRFSLTSNGSLIDTESLAFFARHRFRLLLSYDGLAQESRCAGSSAATEQLLARLLTKRGCRWGVNATFTAGTVHLLAESVRDLIRRGIPEIHLAYAENLPWQAEHFSELQVQLARTIELLAQHYRKSGLLPVPEFNPQLSHFLFACRAGRSRIAVSCDGQVWACHLFAEAFRREPREWLQSFCFGALADRRRRTSADPEALAQLDDLRQNTFRSGARRCWSCSDLHSCGVCPAANLLNGAPVPEVVPRTSCRLQRISIAARRRFAELAAR